MKNKIILDLCGGTGSWSKPYQKAGYDVRLITLPDNNVLNFDINWINVEVYGILAAPPCTMFSYARTRAKTPRDLKEGMKCVRACLNIIWSCMEIKQENGKRNPSLKFWALENPNGILKCFLGKPAFQFNPYDFGDQYQKNTHLWGNFNNPKKNPVKLTNKQKELHKTNSQPLPKFDWIKSKDIHPEQIGKLTMSERRAITPEGFAKAFFEANK